MPKTMRMIFLHMLIQLVTITWSRADVAQSNQFTLRQTIAELIHDLCPLVDICDVNATSAELRPNEVLGRGLVSCCQGCSCHPDCKEKDNCCYPDDYKSDSEAQPATNITECWYTRLGQPKMINGLVPAYKTIVEKPEGGCVDTRPIKISSKVVPHPTCDDIDVTPLGPYYPVFSRDTGAIYKNVLCARCHGINNIDSFSANLTCRHTKLQTREMNSMTEFLNFLETGSFSKECHVDFILHDLTALKDKRCYRDVVDTCTSQTVTFPPKFNPPNLSFGVIQKLCESGFNSPTVNVGNGVVYKNAFCSLCGNTELTRVYLQCMDQGQRTNLDGSISFILNTKMMHTINKARHPKTKNDVCLTQKPTSGRSKQQRICKPIYCPTGKIRNEDGDCELIGNFLDTSKGIVNIKLTPTGKIDLGNESQESFDKRLVQGINENNPWPAEWVVDSIIKNLNMTECDENAIAAIILKWDNINTIDIYDEIEESIRLPWLFEWEAKTYPLTQSLMEYELVTVHDKASLRQPSWQQNHNNGLPRDNNFECGPMRWEWLFVNHNRNRHVLRVNKLYFCSQIQLATDEYLLGPDSSYLESNLTRRTLHDLEFEIVDDKDGSNARVCLNDTILADKTVNEGTKLKTPTFSLVLLSKIASTLLINYI